MVDGAGVGKRSFIHSLLRKLVTLQPIDLHTRTSSKMNCRRVLACVGPLRWSSGQKFCLQIDGNQRWSLRVAATIGEVLATTTLPDFLSAPQYTNFLFPPPRLSQRASFSSILGCVRFQLSFWEKGKELPSPKLIAGWRHRV